MAARRSGPARPDVFRIERLPGHGVGAQAEKCAIVPALPRVKNISGSHRRSRLVGADFRASIYGFGDYIVFRYFGNILGFVTFYLPGVFENNPWPKIVNANLWTLPAEFYCYAILAFCMISRIIYKRMYFTIFFCALSVVFIYSLFPAVGPLLPDIGPGFARSFGVTYYFFVGCLFFHWRSWISINRSAFLISGLLSLVFLEENFARGEVVVLAALTPFVLTYCTVVLGIANWPKLPLVRNGDYSYVIYLYGFPITQALIASFPGLRGHIWLMLLIAPALTTMFSVLSWHRIEHPVLQLKKRFGPVSRPV
jgi:peptidoglycan/LPS O-acetylase OafA/YrhL